MGPSILSKGKFNYCADPGIKNHREKHIFILLLISLTLALWRKFLEIRTRDTFSKEMLIEIIFLWEIGEYSLRFCSWGGGKLSGGWARWPKTLFIKKKQKQKIMLQFPKKTCSLYTIIWINMENNLLGENTGWNSYFRIKMLTLTFPVFRVYGLIAWIAMSIFNIQILIFKDCNKLLLQFCCCCYCLAPIKCLAEKAIFKKHLKKRNSYGYH